MTAKKVKAAPPPSPLTLAGLTPVEELHHASSKALIGLLLWRDRFRNPSLSVTLTERDVTGLKACADYQKIEPVVEVWKRPGGLIVAMVQGGTKLVDKEGNITSLGDAITPIENNQADKDSADYARRLQAIRDNAPALAARLISEDSQGIATRSTITEAAEALRLLASA